MLLYGEINSQRRQKTVKFGTSRTNCRNTCSCWFSHLTARRLYVSEKGRLTLLTHCRASFLLSAIVWRNRYPHDLGQSRIWLCLSRLFVPIYRFPPPSPLSGRRSYTILVSVWLCCVNGYALAGEHTPWSVLTVRERKFWRILTSRLRVWVQEWRVRFIFA